LGNGIWERKAHRVTSVRKKEMPKPKRDPMKFDVNCKPPKIFDSQAQIEGNDSNSSLETTPYSSAIRNHSQKQQHSGSRSTTSLFNRRPGPNIHTEQLEHEESTQTSQ